MKNNALKEYHEKLKSGEISPPERKTWAEKARENPKSLRLAINAKCEDCTCGQREEIRNCTMIYNCSLYHLRPYQ